MDPRDGGSRVSSERWCPANRAATRAAVQAEQQRLGLPADGWPTPDLLDLL